MLLKDTILVGHNIQSDLAALDLQVADCGVHSVYDTATNAEMNSLVDREAYKPQTKLSVLAQHLLGQAIQCTNVHDPEEDAFASLDLFLKYRHLFEESPGVPQQSHLPLSNPRLATLGDGRRVAWCRCVCVCVMMMLIGGVYLYYNITSIM